MPNFDIIMHNYRSELAKALSSYPSSQPSFVSSTVVCGVMILARNLEEIRFLFLKKMSISKPLRLGRRFSAVVPVRVTASERIYDTDTIELSSRGPNVSEALIHLGRNPIFRCLHYSPACRTWSLKWTVNQQWPGDGSHRPRSI